MVYKKGLNIDEAFAHNPNDLESNFNYLDVTLAPSYMREIIENGAPTNASLIKQTKKLSKVDLVKIGENVYKGIYKLFNEEKKDTGATKKEDLGSQNIGIALQLLSEGRIN